jgi:hypothetical protein
MHATVRYRITALKAGKQQQAEEGPDTDMRGKRAREQFLLSNSKEGRKEARKKESTDCIMGRTVPFSS